MSQARSELFRLGSWCERYRRVHDRWPDPAQLVAQRDDLPAVDPWGHDYRVRVAPDGRSAVVYSVGGDGSDGGCDDLRSPPARAPRSVPPSAPRPAAPDATAGPAAQR